MKLGKIVVFYYRNDEGKLWKATLNFAQYTHVLTYCRDYNSLLSYIDTATKWVELKK